MGYQKGDGVPEREMGYQIRGLAPDREDGVPDRSLGYQIGVGVIDRGLCPCPIWITPCPCLAPPLPPSGPCLHLAPPPCLPSGPCSCLAPPPPPTSCQCSCLTPTTTSPPSGPTSDHPQSVPIPIWLGWEYPNVHFQCSFQSHLM